MEKKASLFLLAAFALAAAQVELAVAAGGFAGTVVQEGVRAEVDSAMKTGRGIGAGLIRLAFHDCFVEGCDASVLLSTPQKGTDGNTERAASSSSNAGPTSSGLEFEVINAIRNKLGATDGVTCTDAVVYAAHEAINILSHGAIAYDLDGPGRPDGVTSSSDDDDDQAEFPTSTFAQLVDKFGEKGFTPVDVAALYSARVFQKIALFGSDDAVLMKDPGLLKMLRRYRSNPLTWNQDFGSAMAKLSKLTAPAGAPSEIRRNCGATNKMH